MRSWTVGAMALLAVLVLTPATLAAQNCFVRGGGDAADRASPLDSTTVSIGGAEVKVCYGAPSARGRELVGGDPHPFGRPWRLGANEATAIHLPFAASVAGVEVAAGSYSLYAVPGADEWEIFVNGNAERWGIPVNAGVMEANVGSGTVSASENEHVERMTMTFEDASDTGATLVLRWESYRVDIPVMRR